MNVALSNFDINKIVGHNVPVLTHNDLLRFKNIDQLFTNFPAFLLLYEWDTKIGHWTAVLKTNEGYEFFDSYGQMPDTQKEFIPKNRWTISKLAELLYNEKKKGKKVEYNEVQFQKLKEGITTCGYWVAVRIYYRHIPLNIFQNLFLNFSKKNKNLDKKIVEIGKDILNGN